MMAPDDAFAAFAKEASLDILVPKAVNVDLSVILRQSLDDAVRLPHRRTLFFDEEANILVLLKTSLDENAIRDNLANLDLVLSAHLTEAVPQGGGNAASASGKFDLSSKSIPAGNDAEIVPCQDVSYVIWRLKLHISRPRARIERPAVYFTSNLALRQDVLRDARKAQRIVLKSFEPQPANVLEPLRFDPTLRTSSVHLSESRITKLAPKSSNVLDTVKPVRGSTKRAFPTISVIYTKLRCSALPGEVIASLHLDISNAIGDSLVVNDVRFEVQDISVEPLSHSQLPFKARPGDEFVLAFRLKEPEPVASKRSQRSALVLIDAQVPLEESCHATLSMKWQTSLDRSQSADHSDYAWSRPVSNSSSQTSRLSAMSNPFAATSTLSTMVSDRSSTATAKTRPKKLPGSWQEAESENILFNFTGPATAVLHEEFRLHVQCTNRSRRTRRFALVMHQGTKDPKTMPDTTHESDATMITKASDVANVERAYVPSFTNLNPDMRIGPLAPGACFETDLSLRASTTGLLDLGILRIVDVDSMQIVDVQELPDIVILEQDNA